MVSKNNKQEKMRKLEEKNNHFSIRKFTIGAASVLIGAFFVGVTEPQTAHAATEPATEQVASASAESVDNANQAAQSTAPASEKTQEAPSQTKDDKQALQSQFNQAAQNPGKAASSANTALNNASDSELSEMANIYNASVAQNSAENPAESQSGKDGTAYVPFAQASTDPKSYIGNADEMPEGTKYTWVTSQSDLSKMLMEPGQHTVSIKITFPDGSGTTVTGPYLNVIGSDVQTVTVTQGSDARAISINDAVTDIVPAGDKWNPQSAAWTILPDTSAVGVTMGQAEVTFASGNKQLVVIPVRVTPAATQDITDQAYQQITVQVPNDSSYYWKNINNQTMNGTKSADGTETWNPVSYDAQSIDSVLAAQGFTYNRTGYKQDLPSLDGYTPKITGVQVIGKTGDAAMQLLGELNTKIAANPYEIPSYTIDYPFSVAIQVTYVRTSMSGDPLTQSELPAYTGSVSDIPETQPDLPEAPLPQEPVNPTTPSTPSDNNDNSGQPTDDNNKGNVTPLPNDNSNKDSHKGGHANSEGAIAHSTDEVKSESTNAASSTTVHAATIGNGDQNKEKTLPQTGAENTNAGLFGLMLASLASLLGLAGTKKRKN